MQPSNLREIVAAIRSSSFAKAERIVTDLIAIPDDANARIAELESALMDKTLNKVDVCIQLDAAEKRIAALEALLREAPHDPKCYSQTHCGAGSCKSPPWAEVHIMGKPHYFHEFEPGKCNCFKSRA